MNENRTYQGMQNANRSYERLPLPPSKPLPKKTPPWVWWFYFISIGIFVSTVGTYAYQHVQAREAHDAAVAARDKRELEQKAKRAKAEALAAEGFELMHQLRRNKLYYYCRAQGNVPILLMDKVVCLRSETVAWEKLDE